MMGVMPTRWWPRPDALAAMPDQLSAVDAAPLLCAGVTTFNALRHSGAMPGDVVAVLGIGGLGHLGVQFANKLGFCTVAIARGSDKEALSRNLGAHHFIDSAVSNSMLGCGAKNATRLYTIEWLWPAKRA